MKNKIENKIEKFFNSIIKLLKESFNCGINKLRLERSKYKETEKINGERILEFFFVYIVDKKIIDVKIHLKSSKNKTLKPKKKCNIFLNGFSDKTSPT